MATGNEQAKETELNELQQHIDKINQCPDYKVLTKEEYEVLLNASLKKEQATSTPMIKGKPSPLTNLFSAIKKPMGESRPQGNAANVTMTTNQFQNPKLPTFSGTDEPQKGEVKYEVWNFEVKCLQNSGQYPEHVLLQVVRNSLKGLARSMLVSVGEKASVGDILKKLDGFFGNVASGETLMQSFYNDCQKDSESIIVYASRLEDTLSKAITFGHIDAVAKDGMLRSKFWTGLNSQQLKQSTRHLFDGIKNFETLLREIRKVQQEEISLQGPTRGTKSKPTVLHAERAETSTDLQNDLQKMIASLQRLEQKIDDNSKSFQQLNKRVYQLENNAPNQNHQQNQGRGQNQNNGNRGHYRGRGRGRNQNYARQTEQASSQSKE